MSFRGMPNRRMPFRQIAQICHFAECQIAECQNVISPTRVGVGGWSFNKDELLPCTFPSWTQWTVESSSEHFASDLSLLKADALRWEQNRQCSDSNPWPMDPKVSVLPTTPQRLSGRHKTEPKPTRTSGFFQNRNRTEVQKAILHIPTIRIVDIDKLHCTYPQFELSISAIQILDIDKSHCRYPQFKLSITAIWIVHIDKSHCWCPQFELLISPNPIVDIHNSINFHSLIRFQACKREDFKMNYCCKNSKY